jgi:hypothetical protein
MIMDDDDFMMTIIIIMMIMDDYDFMMMMMMIIMMMIVMILMMMEHTSQSVGKLMMKNAYASDYLLRIERRVFYTATVTLMTELLIQKRMP